jgi:hypothetical protein
MIGVSGPLGASEVVVASGQDVISQRRVAVGLSARCADDPLPFHDQLDVTSDSHGVAVSCRWLLVEDAGDDDISATEVKGGRT